MSQTGLASRKADWAEPFRFRLAALGNVSWITGLGVAAIFSMAAINLADVRDEDASTRLGLDAQVMAKLAVVAALACFGGWSWLSNSRVRSLLGTFPLALLMLVILIFALTSLTGIDPRPALVSSGSIAIGAFAVAALAVRIGPFGVAWTLLLGQFAFIAGSWFCYLFLPHIGVFYEPIGDGRMLPRMAGLAHPNTLGLFAGLTIVVGSFLWIERRRALPGQPPAWWGLDGALALMVLLSGGALVASLSRTPMLALILTALIVGRSRWMRGQGLILSLTLAGVGLVWLLGLAMQGNLERMTQERLGSLIAKSSDAEELRSLTGRSVIWSHTVRLIGESPLVGYGATSSKILLQDYMSYAHNLFLHVALSAGIFALAFLGGAVLWYLSLMVSRPRALPDAVFVLLMVNGLTENVAFEYIVAAPTAWLVLIMAWRSAEKAPPGARPEGGLP